MRARPMVCLFLALSVPEPPLGAQSLDDFAAWTSLIRSPVGAVVPTPPLSRAEGIGTSRAITIGYGTWRFGPGDDETTNLALGLRFGRGPRTFTLDAVRTSVKDCSNCGGWSLGVGAIVPLLAVGLGTEGETRGVQYDVAVQPSVSLGGFGGGSRSSISAAVSLPASLRVPLGGLVIRPFVAPGYGYGRLSGNGTSASGMRMLIGYGLALGNARGTLQAHVGSMQVKLEGAPSVTGFGLAVRF